MRSTHGRWFGGRAYLTDLCICIQWNGGEIIELVLRRKDGRFLVRDRASHPSKFEYSLQTGKA